MKPEEWLEALDTVSAGLSVGGVQYPPATQLVRRDGRRIDFELKSWSIKVYKRVIYFSAAQISDFEIVK